MNISPFWVQAIGLAGTLLFFVSYQCKSNRRLFLIQFVSYICYTLHFLLLGALTGGLSYILNALRSLFLGSRVAFLKSKPVCLLLCLLQIGTLALTWSGLLCLLPVAANVAATLAGYSRNPRKIRAAGMFVNSPLWIVYDVAVGSYAGVLDEVITEVSMVISVIRYGWKNLDRVEP